jgi:hypothetical protein
VKRVKYGRKTSISLSDDAVFRMIFQKRCTFGVVIRVQFNLSWESNSRLSSDHNDDEGWDT